MKNFNLIDSVVSKIEHLQTTIMHYERYEASAPRLFYTELGFLQSIYSELLKKTGSEISIMMDQATIERLQDCIIDSINDANANNRKKDSDDYYRLLKEISFQVQNQKVK